MAEELTQEQLLLLDNLMYVKNITDGKYPTVEDFIEAYTDGEIVLTGANLSGGFEKNDETIQNMKDVLDAIADDPEIMALGIDKSIDGVVRATCFTQYDESGEVAGHVVAFRGTGGVYEAWKDNFEGMYETDTEAQLMAKEYIESLGYTDITVTGHSKGGNLAMYTTVTCGDQIQSCVSFDGQGFGDGFQEKYHYEISVAKDKMVSVSAHNDFVNILLDPIAGTYIYAENNGTGANAHSSYALWETNQGRLKDNGGSFIGLEVEQSGLMAFAHEAQDELIASMSPLDGELFADAVGALVASVMSKDTDWGKTVSDIAGDVLEYADQTIDGVVDTAKRTWGFLEEDLGRLFESKEEKEAREREEAAIKAAQEAEQKALEEAMQAYREELDKTYILHTAIVTCDKAYSNEGINPSYVVLPKSHGEAIHGQPMLTVEDYRPDVNVLNFGICRSPQNPSVQAAARKIIKEVQEETDSWLDNILGDFVDKSKTEVSTS
ncbi:MAG: DUF2974 domain-containing protein [Lachnospiraceae bacterium]|nr:DUF2974 domain-containing protein [Lachnospiraceae bacterium]